MVPATIVFRVLAEDAESAALMIKGMNPTSAKYRLVARKDMKISVYDAGTSMIKWIKHLVR